MLPWVSVKRRSHKSKILVSTIASNCRFHELLFLFQVGFWRKLSTPPLSLMRGTTIMLSRHMDLFHFHLAWSCKGPTSSWNIATIFSSFEDFVEIEMAGKGLFYKLMHFSCKSLPPYPLNIQTCLIFISFYLNVNNSQREKLEKKIKERLEDKLTLRQNKPNLKLSLSLHE